MKYHPDHNKGQEAKFKEINEAYSVLSDARAKKEYETNRAYGSQTYGNYGNYNNQSSSYQDPYRNYQRNQTQHPFNQWGSQQQQNNTQWSNRSYYENPYEAYDKFRQQYEQADRERMKRRQQQYE